MAVVVKKVELAKVNGETNIRRNSLVFEYTEDPARSIAPPCLQTTSRTRTKFTIP